MASTFQKANPAASKWLTGQMDVVKSRDFGVHDLCLALLLMLFAHFLLGKLPQ
jgi:hypothetical protein